MQAKRIRAAESADRVSGGSWCTSPSDADATIERLKPTVLIGVSTHGGAFNQRVVEAMSRLNERPIIFAISNPTDKAECSAEQAYTWSNGKVLFAAGVQFPDVTVNGQTLHGGPRGDPRDLTVQVGALVGRGHPRVHGDRIRDRSGGRSGVDQDQSTDPASRHRKFALPEPAVRGDVVHALTFRPLL